MDNITQNDKNNNNDGVRVWADFPFFIAPNEIIDVEGVFTTYEKLVYLAICRYGNLGKEAFISYSKLALKCDCSRPTVINAVKGLIDKGMIVKRSVQNKDGAYKHNIYVVNYEISGGSAGDAPGGSKGDLPGVVSEVASINKDLINKKERGAPSKPSAQKDEKPKNGSDLAAAIGHYKDWFSLKTDRTPDVKEKDAAALKRVVNSYGLEDTKTMLNLYFEDKDPFYLENGFPLTTFASQVNKFVVKLNNKGFNDLADRKFSDEPIKKEYEGVCSDCNTVIFQGEKHSCYKPDQNTPGHDIRELTSMIGKGM